FYGNLGLDRFASRRHPRHGAQPSARASDRVDSARQQLRHLADRAALAVVEDQDVVHRFTYDNSTVMRDLLLSLLELARLIFARLRAESCLQAAGSLTFTTLLSLVPLATIALALIAAFPVFQALEVEFKMFLLANMVPDAAHK